MRGLRRFVPVLIAAVLIGCGDGGSCWPDYPSGLLFDYGPETITYYVPDGSDWAERRREVFSYDSDKRLLRIDAEGYASGVWQSSNRYTSYTYDGSGRLERDTLVVGSSLPPGLVSSTISYSYNGEGRLEATSQTWTGGPFLQVAYSYDGIGRLNTVEFNVQSSRTTYGYDADSRAETETVETYNPSSGEWELYERISYSCDAEGRISERLWDRYVDGAWQPLTRRCHTYDAAGRTEGVAWDNYSAAGWERVQRLSFAYGVEGRLATIVEEHYDDVSATWLPHEMREFVFTDSGSSCTFEGAWYPEPLAGWILDYYGQGEVNRYLW